MTQNGYYESYSYGNHLEPGHKLTVEHSISFRQDKADISRLINTPENQLQALLGDSHFAEQKIFEKMQKIAQEWEVQAGKSLLIEKAIEYVKTSAIQHSSNKWVQDDYGYQSISNAVYKMSHNFYEDTQYNRETKQSVPVAWYLTWNVRTQNPQDPRRTGVQIAGQERKRFTDKAAMEKYLQGRIKAYAHLFTEESPPIPKEYARYFNINGQLLPGYTVAGTERPAELPKNNDKNKPSLLGRLDANKAEIKAAGTPGKDKKIETEL